MEPKKNKKRHQIAKSILQKKKRTKLEVSHSNFRLYYEAMVIKTAWYWRKNRYTDQWNRIESSETKPCTYSQLLYDKGGKNI